jgi:hypothetical protein
LILRRDEHQRPFCENSEGAPVFDFNLSHASAHVACALMVGAGKIGVDIEEPIPPKRALPLIRRFCSEGEKALLDSVPSGDELAADLFTSMWVEREALAKQDGRGMPLRFDTTRIPDSVVIWTGYLPDTETKIAILRRKALDRKCPMPDEVLEFLVRDSGHDVRMLEGRLTKVIFASKLHEEPISLELARLALNESVNETEEQEDVTPDKIVNAVCGYFKQKRDDLIGKGKKADLVKARQICAYLLCEMLSLPLVSVGNILGGRDHTTIMYARDKMEKLATLNDRVAKEIDDIKNIVLKK